MIKLRMIAFINKYKEQRVMKLKFMYTTQYSSLGTLHK